MKPMNQMRGVAVAGIGLMRWKRYADQEIYDFGSEAILNALNDAGMEWKEIQTAFCGSVYQGTGSGHQVIKEIGMTGIPIVNVENACSSGHLPSDWLTNRLPRDLRYRSCRRLRKDASSPIPSTAFRPTN